MASRFRTIIDKICGLDDRFEMLNERLTLIEKTVGINSFMANEGNVGNVGSGNVGVGSTVPPDVARYQELVKAKAPVGTTVTEPDTSVDGGQTAPTAGNVGSGDDPNAGIDPALVATSRTGESVPAVTDGWPRSAGNVGEK